MSGTTTERTKNLRGVLMPRLKAVREERGLSRQALADATGLDYTFIWRVEKGASGVGFVAADKITDHLGVTLETLTGTRRDTDPEKT